MREMKDSGVEWIGKIPKDWEIARIKNIKKFCRRKECVYSESFKICL